MSIVQEIPLEALFNRWAALLDDTTAGFLRDLLTFMREREDNLKAMLNQGLNLKDNFDGKILSYTTNATPNTQDAISHGRKAIPKGFIVVDQNKAGIIYRSAPFDSTSVYFKCSVASMEVKVFVF